VNLSVRHFYLVLWWSFKNRKGGNQKTMWKGGHWLFCHSAPFWLLLEKSSVRKTILRSQVEQTVTAIPPQVPQIKQP